MYFSFSHEECISYESFFLKKIHCRMHYVAFFENLELHHNIQRSGKSGREPFSDWPISQEGIDRLVYFNGQAAVVGWGKVNKYP